jgi:glycosyltransferase involved in cell wall biosynthesis/SAM-dependent methyltransferase/predicted O-methyltransferase YrrM
MQKINGLTYRGWEYARLGDYHKNLDPNWSYTPTYLKKMAFVRQFVHSQSRAAKILDVACGEGVLVEEFREKGWHIEGLDLNYESECVRRGDVRNLPYPDACFDAVLFLDALEHLAFEDQAKALSEIHRILKARGYLVLSVPNLAHLNSRIRFLLKGNLDRTDIETIHIGERPLSEYQRLLKQCGFSTLKYIGISFTLPFIYRRVICRRPAKFKWLHDLLEPLARAVPSLAMLTIFICQKGSEPPTGDKIPLFKRMQVARLSGQPQAFSILTHLTARERLLLLDLSRNLSEEDPVIVEIGSYLGASTCFLATGARLRGGKVYAVDTWTNIGMSEGSRDTYEEFLSNIKPLKNWIVPLRGLSTELAYQFDEEIDLLFVDADHSYETLRADLQAWLPKLKDGGIVAFHEYGWAEGVRRAVRELVVPLQVEGTHRLDSIYWTRISHKRQQRCQSAISASVIVPTYDRPRYLKEALVSLLQQDFPSAKYEIIAVDNQPTGEAHKIVQELEQDQKRSIRYVEEPKVGLHHARHAGAREARGEILIYVDDDVVVHPHWLSAMVATFAHPHVACVGGKTIPKWETVEPPNWLSWSPGGLSLLDLGEESKELSWPEEVYGCNMAVRRSVLYEVGGFNPDGMGDRRLIWLRGDGETGLQQKIYDAGYKVIYNPQAWLYHCIPASRLTPEYFRWRSFIHGISASYTRIRQYPSRWRMLLHAVGCFLRVLRCYVRSIREPIGGSARRRGWYWYGRGQHQIRVALSPELYRHVMQDTYLLNDNGWRHNSI